MSDAKSHGYDTSRAEAFAQRFLGALNDGALCLMVSVGHRTGLFDAVRSMPPSTSAEIADRAGLNERYVREWLGAMVTSRVMEADPATGRFRLPPEHAAFLTRQAGADNMAVFAQYIPILGSVEEEIIRCFRQGGGVPYGSFARFHEVMAEDSGQSVMSSLESHVLPLIPGLSDRLAQGIRVLDLGCGRGRIMTRLAESFPRSSFRGLDLSEEAIGYARDEASRKKLSNIAFSAVDLSDFDETAEPEAYDWITTFDAIHDQARPAGPARDPSRAQARRGLSLTGDQGLERSGQEPRPSHRDVSVYGLLLALHDRVPRAGRGRPGRDVGRREDARVPGSRVIRHGGEERAGPRHPEQLVRGQKMKRGGESRPGFRRRANGFLAAGPSRSRAPGACGSRARRSARSREG